MQTGGRFRIGVARQLNVLYVLSLAEHALDHMAGSFSRDFFVEIVTE